MLSAVSAARWVRRLGPAEAGGIKVVARTHKTLIWERTRALQRLRHQGTRQISILSGSAENLS